MMRFVATTGSKVADRRVPVLDGFAGRGRWSCGVPASAEVLVRVSLNAARAVIESVLVEQGRSNFAQQDALVTEHRAQGARPGLLLTVSVDLVGRAAGAFKAAGQALSELQDLTRSISCLRFSRPLPTRASVPCDEYL
jgi:hypothetical protein